MTEFFDTDIYGLATIVYFGHVTGDTFNGGGTAFFAGFSDLLKLVQRSGT